MQILSCEFCLGFLLDVLIFVEIYASLFFFLEYFFHLLVPFLYFSIHIFPFPILFLL